MNLFLINFKEENNKIKNKKYQSKLSKYFAEKIAFEFYNVKTKLMHKKDGSPYFLHNENICISISHSKELIVLLFDNKKAGVDIEYMKNRDFKGILEYFKIENTEASKIEFYQLWTDFEARYKSNSDSTNSFIYKNYLCSFACADCMPEVFEIYAGNNEDNYEIKKTDISVLKFLPKIDEKLKVHIS